MGGEQKAKGNKGYLKLEHLMFMWLLEIGYFNVHAVMLWIAQVKYEKLFL